MTNPDFNDRRCAQRISVSELASMQIEQQEHDAKMLDISLCGMSLTANVNPAPLTMVKISLNLPSYDQSHHLELDAQVIRSVPVQKQFLIGLSFNGLSAHQKLIIQEFSAFHHRLSS